MKGMVHSIWLLAALLITLPLSVSATDLETIETIEAAAVEKASNNLSYTVISGGVGFALKRSDRNQNRKRYRSRWVFKNANDWYNRYPNVKLPKEIETAFQQGKAVAIAAVHFTTTSGGTWVRVVKVIQTENGIEVIFERARACSRIVNKQMGAGSTAVVFDAGNQKVTARMSSPACERKK
ncbi:hypothetical protein [Spongorhabdus nitratireducens]